MSLYLNCVTALSCKSCAFSVKPKFDDSQDKQKCIDSKENQYGQIEIVLEWKKTNNLIWKSIMHFKYFKSNLGLLFTAFNKSITDIANRFQIITDLQYFKFSYENIFMSVTKIYLFSFLESCFTDLANRIGNCFSWRCK
jgi:hypothetical protein